jgi:hypothetical protein
MYTPLSKSANPVQLTGHKVRDSKRPRSTETPRSCRRSTVGTLPTCLGIGIRQYWPTCRAWDESQTTMIILRLEGQRVAVETSSTHTRMRGIGFGTLPIECSTNVFYILVVHDNPTQESSSIVDVCSRFVNSYNSVLSSSPSPIAHDISSRFQAGSKSRQPPGHMRCKGRPIV